MLKEIILASKLLVAGEGQEVKEVKQETKEQLTELSSEIQENPTQEVQEQVATAIEPDPELDTLTMEGTPAQIYARAKVILDKYTPQVTAIIEKRKILLSDPDAFKTFSDRMAFVRNQKSLESSLTWFNSLKIRVGRNPIGEKLRFFVEDVNEAVADFKATKKKAEEREKDMFASAADPNDS